MAQGHQEKLRNIYQASLDAVKPSLLLKNAVEVDGGELVIGGYGQEAATRLPLDSSFTLIGFGKAVASMAEELCDILGDRLKQGIISIPVGSQRPSLPARVRVAYGAKDNLPDEAAHVAAQEIYDLVSQAGAGDCVITLISGGGSALLPLPAADISLKDKTTLVARLMRAGADIHELNTVRQCVSRSKGGGLARAAAPATVVALIISDVVGDEMRTIASGPTSPSDKDGRKAAAILQKYGVDVDDRIAAVIAQSQPVSAAELAHVSNMIIGSNSQALDAACDKARALGYDCVRHPHPVTGEAREAAAMLMRKAREAARGRSRPFCFVAGGETTVTVSGTGRGGRNQELALAAAVLLAEEKEEEDSSPLMLLSGGTDGQDGPTLAAGAVVTTTTLADPADLARAKKALADNDSHTFLASLDAGRGTGEHVLLTPGLTGTNVMDVHIISIDS